MICTLQKYVFILVLARKIVKKSVFTLKKVIFSLKKNIIRYKNRTISAFFHSNFRTFPKKELSLRMINYKRKELRNIESE